MSASTVPRSVPIRGAVRLRTAGEERVTRTWLEFRGRAEAESFFSCARLKSRQLTGANRRLENAPVNSSLNP